jgi:hypothetical protein
LNEKSYGDALGLPINTMRSKAMNKFAGLLLVAAIAIGLAGCSSSRETKPAQNAGYTATPNWRAPGNADQQQRRAERFDPYPDNNIAPAVAGGRPPGFEQPLPETDRARWTLGQPQFTGRAAVQPMIGGPAPNPLCPAAQTLPGQAPVGPSIQAPNGLPAVPPVGSP